MDELVSLEQVGMGLLWIDLQAESEQNAERLWKENFAFHPQAVEDALQESHVPRVDDWARYLYLVLHAVRYDQDGSPHWETQELDLYLGVQTLIIVHQQPIDVIQQVWKRCMKDERRLKHGAARLFCHLVDALVAEAMPVSFVAVFVGMKLFASSAPLDPWQAAISVPMMPGCMALLPGLMVLWLRCEGWM